MKERLWAKAEFMTKNDKGRTRMCPVSAPTSNVFEMRGIFHEIFKVKLRSGETFAFDIAGAQHGYHDPVMQWQDYEQLRIFRVVSSGPAPQSKGLLQVQDYCVDKQNFFTTRLALKESNPASASEECLEVMNFHILQWQCSENLSLKAM